MTDIIIDPEDQDLFVTAEPDQDITIEFSAEGRDGPPGRGVVSIAKTGETGLTDRYTITYSDGTTSYFDVKNGERGSDGNGIVSIEKTSSSGLTDTYTIRFTNGTEQTFSLTNGADGVDGAPGATGNGIYDIEKTSSAGLVDTYTITTPDGTTHSFQVTNGMNGQTEWGSILGDLADQTDLMTTINSINSAISLINIALSGKANAVHTHDDRYYTESEMDTKLAGKSDTGHNHDDRYYTESETDTLLNAKANSSALSDYLPLAGGTMTGSPTVKRNSLSGFYRNEANDYGYLANLPSENKWYDLLTFFDKNGKRIFLIRGHINSDGSIKVQYNREIICT